MYYHNTRIMSTKSQPLCMLRRPFDIVFNALFNCGYHLIQPLRKYMILQTCSQLGPQGVPRQDFECIPREFHSSKNIISSRACRPPQQNPKNAKHKVYKKCVPRPPVRSSGGSGGRSPQANKKGSYEPRHPCPLFYTCRLVNFAG